MKELQPRRVVSQKTVLCGSFWSLSSLSSGNTLSFSPSPISRPRWYGGTRVADLSWVESGLTDRLQCYVDVVLRLLFFCFFCCFFFYFLLVFFSFFCFSCFFFFLCLIALSSRCTPADGVDVATLWLASPLLSFSFFPLSLSYKVLYTPLLPLLWYTCSPCSWFHFISSLFFGFYLSPVRADPPCFFCYPYSPFFFFFFSSLSLRALPLAIVFDLGLGLLI